MALQWDREPYSWRAGADAVVPLPIRERRNFIINNYNGVWGLCRESRLRGMRAALCTWRGC